MIVRRLSEEGVSQFRQFLDSLSSERPEPYPEELLEDDEKSAPLHPRTEIAGNKFGSRFEAAAYLDERLGDPRLQGVENDTGVWAWLALLYFDQLCRVDEDGRFRPGEMARWVPENDNFRRYYRHLLRGPFGIYRAHRDDPSRALALLCGPLSEPGDVVEQLSARQELVTNPGVMGTATSLYYDRESKRIKRGAGGRGPGSARRLADLFNQFDVTWDLYGMTAEELTALLPREFNRFRPRQAE